MVPGENPQGPKNGEKVKKAKNQSRTAAEIHIAAHCVHRIVQTRLVRRIVSVGVIRVVIVVPVLPAGAWWVMALKGVDCRCETRMLSSQHWSKSKESRSKCVND
jgi:hypothetical protein